MGTRRPTACLALADGTAFFGMGFGAPGRTVAELCFNTAMTGYQEIMTDPSYAGQIVTFTFPHIGNVGSPSAEWIRGALPARSGNKVRHMWRLSIIQTECLTSKGWARRRAGSRGSKAWIWPKM